VRYQWRRRTLVRFVVLQRDDVWGHWSPPEARTTSEPKVESESPAILLFFTILWCRGFNNEIGGSAKKSLADIPILPIVGGMPGWGSLPGIPGVHFATLGLVVEP
jgi:hypothetical protein